MSWVTVKVPWAPQPLACMRRSGITSRSKCAIFSISQMSCSSAGPRGPAVMMLVLSATGAPVALVNRFSVAIISSSVMLSLLGQVGERRHRTADHAEQCRADAVLLRHHGVADAALRLENLLARGRISGEGIGAESGEQQAGNHGAPDATVALASPEHRFNDPLGLFHCH